jgi:hypothetical protein
MWAKILDFFKSGAPGIKKKPEIDVKGLEKKTKVELEKLGRKVGIELDRRLTKAKLIQQIKKQVK